MTQNGTESKLKLTCTRCNQVWSISPPSPEISNNLRTSVVAIPHEKLVRCPNQKCLQSFVIMIQSVQLMVNAVPVDDDVVEKVEGSKIITPTLGLVQ